MQKKDLKKGFVKKIERNSHAIIIIGPLNKETGLYREKKVFLHCAEALEEFTQEAFDIMRTLMVGKDIEFNDYDMGEKTTADIFVDGKNVAFLLACEGLVKHYKAGLKTSQYYDDLVEGDKLALENKKGQYSESGETEGKKKKKKAKPLNLEDFVGKEVNGMIDDINFKLDFQVYIQELKEVYNANFAGVMIPVVSKEHVTHLRNFISKHILQRMRKFRIKIAENYDVLSLIELNYSDENSVTRNLFTNGYAKLEKEAGLKLEPVVLMTLKTIQDQGMLSGKGIWKDYKGKLPQIDKNNNANADLIKLLQSPEFEARVIAIHSGDSITIEIGEEKQIRVSLTNLKARSMGNPMKDEDPQPWAFEAKEFLRKRLTGKTVEVKIDNVKNVVTEERTFEVINATIFLERVPVAIEMLERGLLSLFPPKMGDPASTALIAYAEAAKKAEILKKGIHSDTNLIRRFWDLSKPENKKKAKSGFSLDNYKDLNEGVVENIMSASRFKIRFDKENCYFILSLNSVKGIPNNINDKSEEKWANEALNYVKRIANQRDIKFEIEQVDKNGVAHGTIFLDKENLALILLSKGFVFVEKAFKHSKYIAEYQKVQDIARDKQKGIWGDPDLNLDKIHGAENDGTIKGEIKTYTLSEFYGTNDFYLQDSESDQFLKIEKVLKKNGDLSPKLKEPILPNTIAIGFFDGEYNRCRVLKKNKKDEYEVEFIDYGNTSSLLLSELRQCPNEIQKLLPQAFNARLEYVVTPPVQSGYAKITDKYMEKLGANAKLKCRILRKKEGHVYCILWPATCDNDVRNSINYNIVKEGLAILDSNIDEDAMKVWEVAGKLGADKNPDLISYMNNLDD